MAHNNIGLCTDIGSRRVKIIPGVLTGKPCRVMTLQFLLYFIKFNDILNTTRCIIWTRVIMSNECLISIQLLIFWRCSFDQIFEYLSCKITSVSSINVEFFHVWSMTVNSIDDLLTAVSINIFKLPFQRVILQGKILCWSKCIIVIRILAFDLAVRNISLGGTQMFIRQTLVGWSRCNVFNPINIHTVKNLSSSRTWLPVTVVIRL